MSELVPDRENLRRAVLWISERRKEEPDASLTGLVDDASRRFDLGPLDQEFLWQQLAPPKR